MRLYCPIRRVKASGNENLLEMFCEKPYFAVAFLELPLKLFGV
jgi:hypothetical protein